MYRRRASPLHAARATAAALFCVAGATLGGVVPNPFVTLAVAVAAFGVAASCGVGREVAGSLRLSVPLALVLVVINVLVVRRGLTVFARLGEVPPFGQVDMTVEALVAGGLVALHVVAVMAWAGVFACCVNPDGLLDAFRRLSFRSALSATLATRLIPVLARDAERLGEARRCRPDGGGGGTRARAAVVRAVATGALDRALDVAATLEVRGYGSARRGGGPGRPWSRHDLAFVLSAVVLVALTVGGRVAGVAGFDPYPELHGDGVVGAGVLAGAIALTALAPFAARKGIGV
jgi:energy-coupling factor transport system permease protein